MATLAGWADASFEFWLSPLIYNKPERQWEIKENQYLKPRPRPFHFFRVFNCLPILEVASRSDLVVWANGCSMGGRTGRMHGGLRKLLFPIYKALWRPFFSHPMGTAAPEGGIIITKSGKRVIKFSNHPVNLCQSI